MSKRNVINIFGALAIITLIVGSIFFYKGYDVKNQYRNSDYSSINKNSYVGGDAYNYIINGTYFTAYMVGGVGFYIMGTLTGMGALYLKCKEDGEKQNYQVPINDQLPNI